MWGIVTELLWFLRGDTNIKYLVDNRCNIWNGDAYKNYVKTEEQSYEKMRNNPVLDIQPLELLSKEEFINKIKTDDEFAKKWGDLGPIYGKQWRSWKSSDYHCSDETFDQIKNVIHLLKTNPDDRGIIVSAWNVGELDQMTLRPCHNFFQFYTRELSFEERFDLCLKHPNLDPS